MRQKAINLDRDKMNALFPSLMLAANTAKYPVQVNWFFDAEPGVQVTQNIGLSQKNWRLNSMPWVDHEVGEGDIVVCQVLGDEAPARSRVPTGVALALVRPSDEGYEWLDARLPSLTARARGGFVTIDDGELLTGREWTPRSSVWQLIDYLTRGLTELVKDVVAPSDIDAVPEIGLRSLERTGTTREAIEKLSRLRSAIGLGGETLVDAVLERMRDAHEIASYDWVSSSNATAPIDFRAQHATESLRIEVKTTKGEHDTGFVISIPELRASCEPGPYEVWRVSKFDVVDEDLVGSIRRSDPRVLAEQTLVWVASAPNGVKVPSVEFAPSALTWTAPESAACPASRVPSSEWAAEMNLAAS